MLLVLQMSFLRSVSSSSFDRRSIDSTLPAGTFLVRAQPEGPQGLTWCIQDAVGGHHVIDNIALADLLATECLGRRQVHAIVVAEVVVAHNGSGLDASAHQEVDKHALHFGLARLEVIASNEDLLLDRKLNESRNKGILWCSIDEGHSCRGRQQFTGMALEDNSS